MKALLDCIWPTPDGENQDERVQRHLANRDDVEAIQKADWTRDAELALSEAKCLAESERARRRVADDKASTYLLVAAALIPLLTYLESAIWDQKAGTAAKWLTLPLLLIGVAYVMGTGFWAFRTLRVRSFVTIDAGDLAAVWAAAGEIRPALATEYLVVARRNRDGVNEKVSAIMLAHGLLLRAFLMFGALLLVEAAWELATVIRRGPIG